MEARGNDAADERIVDNILKRVQLLIERRNDVLHRVWFVGVALVDQTEFDRVASLRFKNTNRSPEFKRLKYSMEDFDRLSDEAEELKGLIDRLDACLVSTEPYSTDFLVDNDGTVRKPPGT